MAKGGIDKLKTGWRARVYAGIDPITKKQVYLVGATWPTEEEAVADAARLLQEGQGEAFARPLGDRGASLGQVGGDR